jgi:hypothetical protein
MRVDVNYARYHFVIPCEANSSLRRERHDALFGWSVIILRSSCNTNSEDWPWQTNGSGFLLECGKNRGPTVGSIGEYARGNAFLALSDSVESPRRQKACPFQIFKEGVHLRDEQQVP